MYTYAYILTYNIDKWKSLEVKFSQEHERISVNIKVGKFAGAERLYMYIRR